MARLELALEPDFRLGPLDVRPSACRVFHGDTEIRVEAQTMSALVVLSRAAGATVTREELVNACWQGRFVSDDAIARTISKVRLLARDMEPMPFILETLPKVGYRLVTVGSEEAANESSLPPDPAPNDMRRRWLSTALVAGLLVVAFWLGSAMPQRLDPARAEQPGTPEEKVDVHTSDVLDAVLSLNEERLAGYLAKGWKVDWPLDAQRNTALHVLPGVCQAAYSHDQASSLKIAKQLIAAGADPALRNKWNDTAYIIAREGRYCGPQHPVTVYLRSITPGAEADPVDKQLGARTDIR
jgi:DNA-binding winged helix-turn-helix (wHTH) protein